MAFLTASTFEPTNDDFVDVMTSGIVWNLTADRSISWAIADGFNDTWDDPVAARQKFGEALASYEQFIDVDFEYVGDFADPELAGDAGADIVYTLDRLEDQRSTLASAYYPGPGVFDDFFQYDSEDGDIFLNFASRIISTATFEPGTDGFITVIHELGHALGLKHPFETEFGRPSVSGLMRDDVLDVDWFTIMSYTDPYDAQLEKWDPATPMLLDVIALQYMYGQNEETNAGHTKHVLRNEDYYYTIWDASGHDRVDASGLSEGWRVSLPDTQNSSLVDVLSGFALPLAQLDGALADSQPTELIWLMGDIENVTGTRFADDLKGNAFANALQAGLGNDSLEGFAGDDVLNGQGGRDTAYFAGDQNAYTVTFSPDGTTVHDRRVDGTGTDTIENIAHLVFYDEESEDMFNLEQFGGPTELSASELKTFIELYIAHFNRAPDASGLWFWGNAFASNLVTLEEAAMFFIDQDETRALYPEGLSNNAFAVSVYNNVLGRTPDDEGLDFWVGLLDAGQIGRDQFILEVLRGAKADPDLSLGPDFVEQQLADRDYLATKTDIGALYAVHRGMSDVENAIAVMDLYDGTQAGTTAAVAAVEQFHAAALDPETGDFLMPLIGVLDNIFEPVA